MDGSGSIRWWKLLALVSALALVAAACGDGDEEPLEGEGGEQAPRTQMTVAFPIDTPSWFGFRVAAELGYYDEENVDPQFEVFDGGGEAVQQLIAGNVDLGAVPTGNIVEAVEQGHTNLRAIFAVQYGSIFSIVVPEDSDISSAEDLAGKKIGVSDLSGGEVPIVRGIVESAGLSEQDVELVPIGEGTPLAVRAITEGQVDAFGGAINDIVAIEVQGLGLRQIVPPELAELPANSLVTTQEFIDANEDAVIGFLRATNKGYVFGKANPDAALAILKEVTPEQFTDPTGERIFEAVLPLFEAPPGGEYGSQTPESWESLFDFIGAELPEVELSTIIVQDFVEPAHDFDRAEVEEDAETFEP